MRERPGRLNTTLRITGRNEVRVIELLGFAGDMQRDGAKHHEVVTGILVADFGEQVGEFVRAEKAADGVGKIGVGGRVAGDKATDFRQKILAVEAIERTDYAGGRF